MRCPTSDLSGPGDQPAASRRSSVAFLSGGQSPVQATEHLQVMNAKGDFPWQLGFSYGRALQDDPLATGGQRDSDDPVLQVLLRGPGPEDGAPLLD